MKNTNQKQMLQIGEVAEKAGTTIRTVRYYMDEGFIEAADRSPGGFYLFEPEAAETVFYIQKLKDAGLALKDIKAVYRARHDSETGHEGHSKVIDQLEAQKALLEKKISDYRFLKSEIEAAIDIAARCEGCMKAPTRENCESCRVVRSSRKIPLPTRAIL